MAADATYPSLRGRTVLVTGGASGIGEAIVRRFAVQGARVGFLDIAEEAALRLLDSLPEGALAHFEPCDITDIPALRAAIGRVRERLGPVTILVNNAANDERHAFESVTPEYWDERMAVNLKHLFFAAQAVAPDMQATGGGAIVNMGSISWRLGQGGMAAYTTAKAGVEGLTRSLARDLGPANIRVNAVLPGWIMTERQVTKWLTPEGIEKLLESQCLKRRLQPDDVARVVLFFASDEASACTNQMYVVDGGWV